MEVVVLRIGTDSDKRFEAVALNELKSDWKLSGDGRAYEIVDLCVVGMFGVAGRK